MASKAELTWAEALVAAEEPRELFWHEALAFYRQEKVIQQHPQVDGKKKSSARKSSSPSSLPYAFTLWRLYSTERQQSDWTNFLARLPIELFRKLVEYCTVLRWEVSSTLKKAIVIDAPSALMYLYMEEVEVIIVCGGHECGEQITSWDATTGERLRVFDGHAEPLHDLQLLSRFRFATIYSDGAVKIRSLERCEPVQEFSMSAHLSPTPENIEANTQPPFLVCRLDKRTLACVGGRTTVIWNAISGERMTTFDVGKTKVKRLVPAENGLLLCARVDGSVSTYNWRSGEQVSHMPPIGSPSIAMGNNKDILMLVAMGNGLAVIAPNGADLFVLNCLTGKITAALVGHGDFVTNSSLRRVGDRLCLSASFDGTVRVWDVVIGRCLQVVNIAARKGEQARLEAEGNALCVIGPGSVMTFSRRDGSLLSTFKLGLEMFDVRLSMWKGALIGRQLLNGPVRLQMWRLF